MDLTQYQIADDCIGVMELQHPDGVSGALLKPDGEPVTVSFVHYDSPSYQAYKAGRFAKELKTPQQVAQRANRVLTAKEIEEDRLLTIAGAVKSWDGVGLGEDDTPCTFENVVRFLGIQPFLEQSRDFLGERANFLRKSAKPLSDMPKPNLNSDASTKMEAA